MMDTSWLLLILCQLLILLQLTSSQPHPPHDGLRIGAFNIKVFGKKKVNKPDVMEVLVEVARRYDILMIQEIRDKTGKAIRQLLREINAQEYQYEMVLSNRLGRTQNMEQYAFIYRHDAGLKVVATYQDDDHHDLFEREPFAVKFAASDVDVSEFVLMAIHVDPDDVVGELNALVEVHNTIQEDMNTENILIMGDFNAGCRYLRKAAAAQLELREEKYHWLIADQVDTTVSSKTRCAYDRFIMTGDEFINAVIPGSAKVYHFDRLFNLNETQALRVSDHYPIELLLKWSAHVKREEL